jgi:DNA polymerase-3 subunit beta
MKISSLQENLSKGLSVVGRAVASRSTLPQASHVLLASDEGRLKLVATNLEIAITCWIGAQVEEEGAVTVPARLLADFVTSLPSERIDLTVAPRTRQLALNCARNEASIAGMDAADFPPVPRVDDGFNLKLDPKSLRTAVEHVEFAAAADDTRPVLTGIHSVLEGSEITLAAADGFRLAVYKLALDQEVPEKVERIVPARAEEIGEHRGEIDVKIEGEASKVAFNSKYLQEVLQVLDCSQVALETTTSSSPGVIRPVGVENYVHVVMPMFVQW